MATPSYGLTPRLRSSCQQAGRLTRADGGRYVDLGIELRVVAQDVEGGATFLAGKPPLRPVARHVLGGVWDTLERRFVRPSDKPLVWYAGERQADLLLRIWKEPLSGRRWLLVSAEGGGKTVTMSQALWIFILALARDAIFGAIGATAPTHTRLDTFIKAICEAAPVDSPHATKPEAFGTYYTATKDIRCVTGHVIQPRATKKASEATGSPVQGFTWLGCFDDELQDTVSNGADADIESRLRGSRASIRVCTATAKDSPVWRSFRDLKSSTPDWSIERIRYDENPFVWPDHWQRLKRQVSLRDWQRRALAMDVGPERMVYTAWDRDQNLRPVPQIGAEDVTAQVLAPYGADIRLLVSHDPGKLVDVSLFYKAFRFHGAKRHVWFIVGELNTEQTTTEQHVDALLKVVRERWGCNQTDWRGNLAQHGPKIFVRADPYSNSGNDAAHPDRSVYTIFRRAGIQILPAAMKSVGAQSKVAAVPKEAGINMVNRLLCDANGERRLFVACDDRRQPLAPRTVEALEMSERNGDGEAEAQPKTGMADLSHWTSNIRFGLWALERPRYEEQAA